MQTISKTHSPLFNCIIVTLMAVCMAWAASAGADEAAIPKGLTKWQFKQLFEPTPGQRAAERRGRVMIYDGVKDRTVDRVLEQQFDRIQSMMFTRVIRTDKSGEPKRTSTGSLVYEDDGC